MGIVAKVIDFFSRRSVTLHEMMIGQDLESYPWITKWKETGVIHVEIITIKDVDSPSGESFVIQGQFSADREFQRLVQEARNRGEPTRDMVKSRIVDVKHAPITFYSYRMADGLATRHFGWCMDPDY